MMDMGSIGHISFNMAFLTGLLSVIVINLILSGDNAVVIAMAVRSLPKKERLWGIIIGTTVAVAILVVLTFFAAQLLQVEFLKLIGGCLIAWIAVKLFTEGHSDETMDAPAGLWQAVKMMVFANVIMSTDNVLGIAGASKGNLFLLLFGLGTSIPIVVGGSTILAELMDRYPIIVVIGSAILGKVAGEMIITDPWVASMVHPSTALEYGVEILFAASVIVVGKLLLRRKIAKAEVEAHTTAVAHGHAGKTGRL